MSLPIITVTGNVRKIETKQTGTGKNITKVSISCGDKKADNTWDNLYINAEFWEKDSDFVSQHFREGSAVTVSGKLYTNVYEKQDGTKVYENKFMFPRASFVPRDQSEQQHQQTQAQPQAGQYGGQPSNTQYAPPEQQNKPEPINEADLDNTYIPF